LETIRETLIGMKRTFMESQRRNAGAHEMNGDLAKKLATNFANFAKITGPKETARNDPDAKRAKKEPRFFVVFAEFVPSSPSACLEVVAFAPSA
jgi:hypothetical protein